MPTTTVTTPYATAMPYATGALLTWTGEYDAQRLASYDLYDDLYDNSPDTAKMMLRGSDDDPVYLPTAKRLINTMSRYVGKGWTFADAEVKFDEEGNEVQVDTEQYALAVRAMRSLFVRERLTSIFHAGKKGFLRRGDWCWMISGDPLKAPNRRISVREIDPRTYFPRHLDPTDLDRVTGCEIQEESVEENGDFSVTVQRWVKAGDSLYDEAWAPEVAYEKVVYSMEDYADPTKRKVLRTETPLDTLPGVFALPVYHIKNNEAGGNPYGRSELAGLESLVAGINQSISDEDLALAIAGLGMFWTDGGAPVDEEGEVTNWQLGPQEVIEVGKGSTFSRLDGIKSVEPSQTHIKFLQAEAYGVNGLSDVAMGTASNVEAGISLALKLSPVFDAADEKDMAINAVLSQLLHDLRDWFLAYESIDMSMVEFSSVTSSDDRMPFDRDARFTELMALLAAGAVSLSFVHNELNSKFGYEIDALEAQAAVEALAARAQAGDPYATRGNTELEDDDEPEA